MTEPKIALVTGANKGIGLEIARQLAQQGVIVLIGARDQGRAKAAVDDLQGQGLTAHAVAVDLNDETVLAAAAKDIETRFGHLDILVNNAGIFDGAADGPPSRSSLSAVRTTMETNFFGTLAVTQAMLPLLRKANGARIVNLSSSLGSMAVNGDPSSPYYSSQFIGYNASKAALNMLTVQLAEELKGDGIAVYSVSPGYVATDLTAHSGFLTPEQGAKMPVQFALGGDASASGKFFDNHGEPTPW